MNKRGRRVVSSGKSAADIATTATTSSRAADSAAAAGMDFSPLSSTPSVQIPVLDIFSRFQQKHSDFDADWILMQDDAPNNDAPPISSAVAEKLRRHQGQMQINRAAGGVGGVTTTSSSTPSTSANAGSTAAVSGKESRNGNSNRKNNTTAKKRGVDVTAVKGGDDFEQVASMGNEQPAPRRVHPSTRDSSEEGGNGGDDDEDEDYSPEDATAAQYQHKSNIRAEEDSEGSISDVESVQEEVAEKLEEGLVGDYLNFMPKTGGADGLTTSDLQATVMVPAESSAAAASQNTRQRMNLDPNSGGDGEDSYTNNNTRHYQGSRRNAAQGWAGGADGQREVVVPLWSVARMKEFGGYCRSNVLLALHQEITDLVDYLRPTQAEISMRRFLEKEVTRLAQKLWPGSRVLVYGSMYTHLLLPTSDLDMTLLDAPVPTEEALTALAKEIAAEGLCEASYPQVILKTKVPLIKFAHKGSLLEVDISTGATDGKANSDCVIRLLRDYPEAASLIILVKYFLAQRGLHEPYHGGLGSYAATLLVVGFLQQHPLYTTHPEERTRMGLGKLLVDFFRLCGQYWNFAKVGLRVTGNAEEASASASSPSSSLAAMARKGPQGRFFQRSDNTPFGSPTTPTSPRSPLGPTQAFIEDPVDANNNAASSLRNMQVITTMFTYAYLALTGNFDSPSSFVSPNASAPSPSAEDIACRPTLLSRIFHVDADLVARRQRVAAVFDELCQRAPAMMKEVKAYRAEEDLPMLDPTQRRSYSATSTEERQALNRLRSLAAIAADADAEKNQASSAAATHKTERRKRERSSSSTSVSEDGREEAVDCDQDSDGDSSNASSVRVDLSRPTKRRRQLERDRR